ncbi:hypothetical protein HJO_02030 [Hyphomonas johnsonii MHS-2]|uniref:Rhodanese domain-containing protein n=1 Tax=Hyphomonas johnsonii MHS-2 TaxID=1280950 RepID=A0A059FTU9_9PROT|nr:hypothetical protein HJO_02030 [Hyphomonas johnsonii MHS-2]
MEVTHRQAPELMRNGASGAQPGGANQTYPQQNFPAQTPYSQPNVNQPAYPAQPAYPQSPAYPGGAYPAPTQPQGGMQNGVDLDQLGQMERQDFGVQAMNALHSGPMHGPTPSSIPGGQVITTKGMISLVQDRQVPFFLFDVLGGPETLPNAMPAVWMSQPGSFRDQTQQQVSQILQQGTQGRKDTPLVFYCLSSQCWMSYNAALRAINAGYSNVLWYRGGIEAWKSAGQPISTSQQGYGPQGGTGNSQQPY